jgi:predicted SAM-dependent methyltransferase
MIRLDIGSGGKSSDSSFIGVDAYAEGADIKAFMWDLPYEDNSVDIIVSNQALEHVSKFDVIPTLREWHRVLKPGGHLQVIVPDLEWAVTFWLEHKDMPDATAWPMDIIYGNQNHEGEFHKTGFTKKILWDYLVVSEKWFVHVLDFWQPELPQYDVTQRCILLQAEKYDPDKNYEAIRNDENGNSNSSSRDISAAIY